MATLHAFDFLEEENQNDLTKVVLFGDDNFLKLRSLAKLKSSVFGDAEDEINFVKLNSPKIEIKDVVDELSTVSLFGGGTRLVYLEEADDFVGKHRSELESKLSEIDSSSLLVLDVGQWRSNTKLYKLLDKSGLQIDCRLPTRGKSVNTKQIAKWISSWAKKTYQLKIKPVVAEHLIDLTGPELGILDQNLSKLALYLDAGSSVDENHIQEYVGGWQTKTIWEMIDLALEGHTGAAIKHLDRLFQNGESAQALFGQMSWSLRRYALAFDEAQRFTRTGRRMDVNEVMSSAGFRFPPERKKAIEQLKKIGRDQGAKYYKLLLECDLALKSSHSSMPRARIAVEKLILNLVGKAA